jgi:hypothetical protein
LKRFKPSNDSNVETSSRSFFLIKKKQKIKAAEKLAKMSTIALQRKSYNAAIDFCCAITHFCFCAKPTIFAA